MSYALASPSSSPSPTASPSASPNMMLYVPEKGSLVALGQKKSAAAIALKMRIEVLAKIKMKGKSTAEERARDDYALQQARVFVEQQAKLTSSY